MSVKIIIPVSELFKMASTDASAAARVAQEAAHLEETKKLYQIIHEQKMELTNLKWDSFAATAAAASAASAASAANGDGVAAAAASDAAATARLAQEARHQQEIKELTAKFQEQIKTLNHFHLQSGKHYERRAEEDQEVIHKAEEWLEEAVRSEENAQKRANAAEETVSQQKAELERMNVRAAEVALEKKAAYKELVSRFDASTTFYRMKLEEAEEVRARLEKQLKEEEETLEEVSKRECALGQRVREATLRAEKVEANFLRLCGAIDITLKDFPQYRKKLWDHYMLTAPSCGEMDIEFDDPVPFVPTTANQ